MPVDSLPSIEGHVNVVLDDATLSVTAEVVSLDKEAVRERLSVDDEIKLGDAQLRQWMTNRVVRAFGLANGVTLAALGVLVVLDEINIWLHLIVPGDRIVTPHVIMALLGATTVQVGAITVIISRYLFPGRSRNS